MNLDRCGDFGRCGRAIGVNACRHDEAGTNGVTQELATRHRIYVAHKQLFPEVSTRTWSVPPVFAQPPDGVGTSARRRPASLQNRRQNRAQSLRFPHVFMKVRPVDRAAPYRDVGVGRGAYASAQTNAAKVLSSSTTSIRAPLRVRLSSKACP